MNHDELKDRMVELDDAELPAAERAALEGHAASCAECRARLETWRAARRTFFPAPERPTRRQTELFVAAVMRKVEKPGFGWRDLLAPAFGLAFAAAVAVGFLAPRTPRDPAEALLERDSGLYAYLSQAPATADDALALAEDR